MVIANKYAALKRHGCAPVVCTTCYGRSILYFESRDIRTTLIDATYLFELSEELKYMTHKLAPVHRTAVEAGVDPRIVERLIRAQFDPYARRDFCAEAVAELSSELAGKLPESSCCAGGTLYIELDFFERLLI
jgi:hypothetical protein